MIVERIEQYLRDNNKELNTDLLDDMRAAFDHSVTRQLMENREKSSKLRGSNPGPCSRQMAYDFWGFEATTELEPRALITFLTGDLLELVAAALIKMSGIKVENTCLDEIGQAEGFFDVGNGLLIPCHGDGIIPPQPGVCDERVLLEIKSTSDFGFKREWKKGKVGDRYLLQHHVYLETFGIERGVFLVINKNTGHFTEVLTWKDPEIVERARSNYAAAGNSDPDNLPDRFTDGQNYGRRIVKGTLTDKLAWGCTYCAHLHSCWPNLEVTVEKGRPVHRVAIEPVDPNQEYLDL